MPPKKTDDPPPSGPLNLLRPLLILGLSFSSVFPTILSLLLSLNFAPFFSFSLFQSFWFARFWSWFGPRSRQVAAPSVLPLLRASASGVCLDIGPGAGLWLDLFARAHNPHISRIYGVEPNLAIHDELRRSASSAGLQDVYSVLPCAVQDLGAAASFSPASVDTIITVQCLCSIPNPREVIAQLYPLLKPGGKWLVYEHVRTKHRGEFVWYWQKVLNIVWPHFLNGCDVLRPTDQWLLELGEWEEGAEGLKSGVGEGKYDSLPHAVGVLTKKKAAAQS